jgi:hypothetical protein
MRSLQREAAKPHVPPVAWLGTSLSAGDDIATLIAVDKIRRGPSATQADPATLHLSEAETIHFPETNHRSWTFVGDTSQPSMPSWTASGSAPLPLTMSGPRGSI